MKRKIFYSIIMICFISLLSSANQNKKNCTDEASWIVAKSNCILPTPKSLPSDAGLVPLNLFLFDL